MHLTRKHILYYTQVAMLLLPFDLIDIKILMHTTHMLKRNLFTAISPLLNYLKG